MAKKSFQLPRWAWMPLAFFVIFFIVNYFVRPVMGAKTCPGSQVFCPGVGCVSGQDKCFPNALGGAAKIFSKETFTSWPGAGVRATPPVYEVAKETFAMKTCPDGTRSDGPCLLQA
jgi:hypothetical protein